MSPRRIRASRSRRLSTAAGVLLWAALAAFPAPAAEPAQWSAAVQRLQSAGPGERHAFALLALEELITGYAEERSLAETASARPGECTDLEQWCQATDQYLNHLRALHTAVERGAPVSVRLGEDGVVQLHLGRTPVLLTGPRLASPQALQDLVLSRYCRSHSCGGPQQPHLAPAQPFDGGVWSLAGGRGPAFLTHDGLEFPFANLQARAAKRAVSEALAAELRRLADHLRGASPAAGETLEMTAGPGDRIRVAGASPPDLEVSAPALRSAPWLWSEGLHWAQSRARGRAARAVLPGLERLIPGEHDLAVSARATARW